MIAWAIAFIGTAAFAAAPPVPSSITLTGPSVVIVHGSSAEVAEAREEAKSKSDEAFAEFQADFSATNSRFVAAMKNHPQVKVIASSVSVIRFSDPSVPPVWRYSVGSGYGYVFYQPGRPIRVFSGVRTADGLLCEAARVFDFKPKPPKCES